MSRRNAGTSAVSVQVFPFLAVLLCTTGALVFVLLVLARNARAAADRGDFSQAAQRAADLQATDALETLEFRADELRSAHAKTTEQLHAARLALSQIEDHMRRLRDELAALRSAAEALEAAGSRADGSATVELERLHRQIARLREEVARAEALTAARTPVYAVVPYQGKHGTRRRPIYLECRGDAIVLQPEGIEFTVRDFDGPMGPSNPLAAAARAVREHIQAHSAEGEEPYPLLLVRPDGAAAYAFARGALESWGDDFGYELIDEDWQIDYPPADPQLAERIAKIAEEARQRQRHLILAAPREYRRARKFAKGGTWGQPGFASEIDSEMNGEPRGAAGRGAGHASSAAATSKKAGGQAGGENRGQAGAAGPSAQDGPSGLASSDSAGGSANQSSGQANASLAATRGQDWSLPSTVSGSYPVTRPLLVKVLPDRLTVLAEGAAELNVPMPGKTQDSVDPLVEAVWKQVKSWGMAGRRMYWRPTLVMEVDPRAERRFAELKTLLSDSGLDVERRGDSATQVGKKGTADERR